MGKIQDAISENAHQLWNLVEQMVREYPRMPMKKEDQLVARHEWFKKWLEGDKTE